MLEKLGQFTISSQQNNDFAALSGDFNPLHVDEIYSRRLQFGHPVIHGIHHLLRSWDEALYALSFPKARLIELSANFLNPVSINQMIDYHCKINEDKHSAKITAYCEDKKILSLIMRFSSISDLFDEKLTVDDEQPPIEKPVDQAFPPQHSEGACQLCLDTSLAKKLFKSLPDYLPSYQLAQILACTRVVGMRCPGLHSIFSKITLKFDPEVSVADQNYLYYFERHKDARVNILKLGVEAQGVSGSLDTFFRPPPVSQPSYQEVSAKISKNKFFTQRALIVGGSRGVGETTAKILAASGSKIMVTYNKGREEAKRVANEINNGGGHCQIMKIDVNALSKESFALFDLNEPPTHIYYFASPHISSNRTKIWDSSLFTGFCKFYLDAFSEMVKLYAEETEKLNVPITFFFPSTVFIEQPEKGFSEYAAAKGAGEVLCRQLVEKYQHIRFVTPRLSRMATDQTSSIIPIKCESVLDVMCNELKRMENIN